MKLTMLGTGHALVTKYYNTCFTLTENGQHFLVDGGGGSQILRQLEESEINYRDIHDIFLTHQHVDHFMGIIWIVRVICSDMHKGIYEGEANIYSSAEVIEKVRAVSKMLLRNVETQFLDDRLHLIAVEDGETREVMGHKITFFDIGSKKAKQFGFTMELGEGKGRLTCLGDEPCHASSEKYVQGSEWLMHEAFCLYADRDIYHPYEISHSTAKDAAELAARLGVENLLLYHTEDDHFDERGELYTAEGRAYFNGRVVVPEDLDSFEI